MSEDRMSQQEAAQIARQRRTLQSQPQEGMSDHNVQASSLAQRLQEGYLYLIKGYAHGRSQEDRDERQSQAAEGLAVASHDYDPDRHGLFEHYACSRIEELLRPNDEEIRFSTGLDLDTLPSRRPQPVNIPDYILTLRDQKILSYRQCEILVLRFGLDGQREHTDHEIGLLLTLAHTTVTEYGNRAVDILRTELSRGAEQYHVVLRDTA